MGVQFSDLMGKIPSGLFEDVLAEYQVDRYNHKLTGQSLFQILLYNFCEEDRISLRVIEQSFEQHAFKVFHQGKAIKASKSGISDRLKSIDYRFYEAVFHHLLKLYEPLFSGSEGHHIKRFHSKVITLSSKLLRCGFSVPQGSKHQIKLSMGFNGLPQSVRFGETKSDMSEDIALRDAIKQASLSKEDIVVFDRGIAKRQTFKEFSQSGISFVTRLNDKANYKIIRHHTDNVNGEKVGTLVLQADAIVHLRSKTIHWVPCDFRLVIAQNVITHKTFYFLTNILDLTAAEVTEIYKTRWDIEVFFKFIKQHLNAKHFLSRSLNGIKVVFYMMMIAAL